MNNHAELLLEKIDYRFDDPHLFDQALTHRSFGAANNERLEFLGDAVLGMVISDILYGRFPQASEGELSQLRASLVKGTVLAQVARELGLGECIHLGDGELKTGGSKRASILANTFEALIGALYIDAGLKVCREKVECWFAGRLSALSLDEPGKDAKTRLQEHLQKIGRPLPVYELLECSGEAHQRTFTVRCRLRDSACQNVGSGSSRKRAEQIAAGALLAQIENAQAG